IRSKTLQHTLVQGKETGPLFARRSLKMADHRAVINLDGHAAMLELEHRQRLASGCHLASLERDLLSGKDLGEGRCVFEVKMRSAEHPAGPTALSQQFQQFAESAGHYLRF